MGKIKDLTGLEFNRLIVKQFSHIDKNGCSHWVCQCYCGEIIIANSNRLKVG